MLYYACQYLGTYVEVCIGLLTCHALNPISEITLTTFSYSQLIHRVPYL